MTEHVGKQIYRKKPDLSNILDFVGPEEGVRDSSASNFGFKVDLKQVLTQINQLESARVWQRFKGMLVFHFDMALSFRTVHVHTRHLAKVCHILQVPFYVHRLGSWAQQRLF